jgi:Tat protein translocase TatB subunit
MARKQARDMFGTLGGPELFLIFVVALIVFGPRKLPEIGKSLGKMMAEFRRASNEFRSTIESEVEAEKIREAMRIEPPKVEPVAPFTSQPAVSSAPSSSPESTPATPPEGQAASTEQPVDPSAQPAAQSTAPVTQEAAHEAVPQTVSRQPESTPIEPK